MKKFIFVPDKTSPLIFMDLSFQVGATLNPKGKSGLGALTAEMLLRGTRKKKASVLHEALEMLGVEVYVSQGMESTHIRAEVLKENLKPFLKIFKEIISTPSFSDTELKKVKNQLKAVLKSELSSDRKIANRRFQEYLLFSHPYGQMPYGNMKSIDAITRNDIKKFYKDYFTATVALFSITGNLSKEKMKEVGEFLISSLPKTSFTPKIIPEPSIPKGRNLLILDKKDCSQTRILMAAKGISQKHPDYHAMEIASHAFGGSSFSAWMMREIREKRGWTYGAYADYFYYKQPLYYKMWTTPSNKDTLGTVQLMLQLFEKAAKKGISKRDFDFAKKSLLNQYAFSQDTPKKRLYKKVEEALLELPKNFHKDYQKNLKNQNYKKIQGAIKRNFDSKNLFICILGTSKYWMKEVSNEKSLGLSNIKRNSYEKEAEALLL